MIAAGATTTGAEAAGGAGPIAYGAAVVALVGWPLTREVRSGDAQTRQAALIFLVAVPGVVSLILGAVAGFWTAHRRRIG